jgi:hypothetical protein
VKFPSLLLGVVMLAGGSRSQGAELSALELKTARKIYVGKCAKCHKLYDPKQYSPEKWNEWMEKMNRKARLKPEQIELLARYLAAGRAGTVQLPK